MPEGRRPFAELGRDLLGRPTGRDPQGDLPENLDVTPGRASRSGSALARVRGCSARRPHDAPMLDGINATGPRSSACCPLCCPLGSCECPATGAYGRIPHGHRRCADAGGGGRTHTSLRTRDFESRASASSATPARTPIVAPSARGASEAGGGLCPPGGLHASSVRAVRKGARGGNIAFPRDSVSTLLP